MDELNEVYKRKTQSLYFMVALIISVIFNLNAITIAEALWGVPAALSNLSSEPQHKPVMAAENLDATFSLGWNDLTLWSLKKTLPDSG